MNLIREAAAFVKQSRTRLCQGEYTRAPLTILRLEWRGDSVECDWLIRPPDVWDRDLPERKALEHQTLQAFRDALALRDMVFNSFSAVLEARLRMYRADDNHQLELLMIGKTTRLDRYSERVASLAMRAKLSGFQFVVTNGVLEGPLEA
jgi:hypothetical protein